MMRKLAVTIFAMSLTLVGCGSSSTSKHDAAIDGITVPDAGKDSPPSTDTVAAETGNDVKAPDVAPRDTVPLLDVPTDTTPQTDAHDGAAPDRVVSPDMKLDTKPTDAPADTAPAGDAGEMGGDALTD